MGNKKRSTNKIQTGNSVGNTDLVKDTAPLIEVPDIEGNKPTEPLLLATDSQPETAQSVTDTAEDKSVFKSLFLCCVDRK